MLSCPPLPNPAHSYSVSVSLSFPTPPTPTLSLSLSLFVSLCLCHSPPLAFLFICYVLVLFSPSLFFIKKKRLFFSFVAVGFRAPNQTVPNPLELITAFPYLKPGGDYRPPDCRPKQRTAIIIPYRNRWHHLHILLNNLVPFLVRQQASFTIFVIEQVS